MPHIVVIGGSAGSADALKLILQGLPADFPAPVLIVTHIGARESVLPSLLARHSVLPVRHALQGDPIVAGEVLVAPADMHLTVAMDSALPYVHLSRGPKENHSRPAIDPLFRTAAATFKRGAIAVVLSGFLDDGTVGLQAVKACGGIAVVQDPDDARVAEMPASALQYAAVDFVRPAAEIAPLLVGLAPGARPAATPAGRSELPAWINVENRIFDGSGGMEELDSIGKRVPLTCPECGGAVWEIGQARPPRYRCHTGHAFTARVLEGLQHSEVEEALWGAIRSLHEQEQLLRHMAQTVLQKDDYLARAEQAGEHGRLLRELVAERMRIDPV